MSTLTDDRLSTIASMTRRSFLRRAGLALVSFSISAASEFFDWLTRIISTDRHLRFAG